jgi:uncharacterized protein (TIGR02147 family)
MTDICASKNSLEFLQNWFYSAKEKNQKLTFEAIAQRAGYSSRSFVRQVILGEKPMTAKALPRFINVMKLSKDQETLFRLLLEKDYSSFNIHKRDQKEIDADIRELQNKIQLKKSKKVNAAVLGSPLMKQAVLVYPYIGREKGTNAAELSAKCGVSAADCTLILKDFVKAGFVEKKGGAYFATERLLQVKEESSTELLKSHMRVGLSQFSNLVNSGVPFAKDQLLFRAQYSVEEKRAEEFKSRLRSLLVEFVEASEADEGKKIINLVCGFF